MRGFDTFYGYYNGMIDYYSREFKYLKYNGYDFRRNLDVEYDVKNGSYATDLFTEETVDIIHNRKDKSKPFFLMLNHLARNFNLQFSGQDLKQFFSSRWMHRILTG
jgi:arylsulfatase B